MSEVKILFKRDAQEELLQGVNELTAAVAPTLGPRGKTVIIDKGYGVPHITKDGVTVARAYDTDDPVKRMGATLVKMVAAKTADEVGDGTTTATILTKALMEEGLAVLPEVKLPYKFKAGLEEAVHIVTEFINEQTQIIEDHEIEKVLQIATISSNGDEEIGNIIAGTITKIGNEGIITVEESSKGAETTVEITTGFQWEKGLVNPYFVTNPERVECVLDNPYVLICGQNINYPQEILPIVQTVYTAKRSLLIVAPNASNDLIKFLVTNIQQQNGLKAAFVKAPGYGQIQKDMIEDLAVKVGAKTIGDEFGRDIDMAGTDWLGECEKAIISTNKTIIIGGKGSDEELQSRVAAIKTLKQETTSTYDAEKYGERIARLTGGAAVIYVGADSEVEMKERKDRVDDAIAATKAALDEGYIPGGGIIHLRAAWKLAEYCKEELLANDYLLGITVVKKALKYPFRQLCTNAGYDFINAEQELYFGGDNLGFCFNTGKIIDLLKKGIIDPAKVARVTLQNSVSVAAQFLNTSCAMALADKK